MGRSKFPGKPSKHVNRKRINVLPATSDTIIECSQSLTVETTAENKQELSECMENDEDNLKNTVNISKVSLRKRLNRKLQNSKNVLNTSSSKRNLISKICNKTNNRTINNKSSRQTNINRKSLHGYSMKTINKQQRKNKNTVPKETNNSIVGKFVLPTRSVHSSRVIKPNKRFINVDLNDTLPFKKKTVNNKKSCEKSDDDCKQPSSDNKNNSISDQTSSSSTPNTNSTITSTTTINTASITPSTSSNNGINITTNTSTTSPTKPLPNGRIVLRQARLKLHTQTTISNSDGPFSSNITNNSPPGTVTCGVCGAVRFYRFVKQARKFNIYSCESCRKFISKMIKRQNCGKNTSSNILVCHEGQGMCHVPPVVRNQQMKVVRCGYKARCPACWLKMCLRSFQMPLSLKHSLAQLLPKYMQGSDVMFSNSLPLLWQMSNKNLNNPITNDIKNNNDNIKQRPVRLKSNTSTSTTTTKSTTLQSLQISNDIKRQKIDLKGPRVKHVCRSASIVLGQPQATFPIDIDKNKIDNKEQIDNNKRQKIETKSNNSEETKTSIKINKNEQISSENELSDSDKNSTKLQDIIDNNAISFKRDKLKFIDNKLQTEKKRIRPEIQSNMVYFDYYDNYDLDDINHNGLCLISSQQFLVNGVCFLCGSGGRETLLYCSLCCEPYHPYCLEQLPLINNNNNNRQFIWLCPKCTKCTFCNQPDRQKINCQMCSKTYHPECLDAKRNGNNHRPNVCFECLTCKNCKNQITNLNGNLPFCSACLKIRKESNICTLCLNIFKEDVDELIMECTNCHKWVHVKCEGLSEEYYQILTLLPEKLRYICRLCSKEITPYWRKLVDAELNFNFNQVIRLLIKNKIARNILKLNPINKQKRMKKLQCDDNDIDSVDEIDDIDDGVSNVENNINNDNNNKNSQIQCNYDENINNNILTIQNIRNKLNSNQYSSLKEFDSDMEEVLNKINSIDLIKIYRSILNSIFPWYNKQSKSLLDGKFPIQKQHILTDTTITFDNSCTQIDNNIMDTRYCQLCRNLGDGYSESRLLYCGQNEWVHANCALWSDEVYEEIDGSLQNVYDAINRGRITRCTYCKQKGATLSCCYKNCMEIYHFICAKNSNCTFMNDKKIYCLYHLQLFKTNNQTTNFQLSRTMFVELNNDKEKYYPIDKVNVMIGSLRVINLGKINPLVSDNVDVLIPTGYVCTRLYWSTVEPWKLVNYKITTSVINCNTNNSHIERNFTIDHTLSRSIVERKLKEVYVWQKDIDRKRTDIINDFDDDDEPQNGAADLLSPEITDAIFEELPHELLDGISVQDIFPKLMTNYEDFVTNDTGNKLIDNSNNDNNDNENFNDFNDNKNQQRSCSLTLSCKLDNTFSPAIKKRKIAPPRENNLFFQLLQVDGTFDDSGSSDCESPTDNIDDTIITTPAVTNIWSNNIEEPVTCGRCHCTYRTKASYKRHLDSCELICSSESDSELNQEQDNCINIDTTLQNSHLNIMEKCSTVVINETTQQPVVLTSSFESYQNEIHTAVLNTHQTFVSSKSAELITTVPQCNNNTITNNINSNNTNGITTANNSNNNIFVSPITQTTVDSNNQQHNDGFTTVNRCPTLSVNESVPIQNNQFCLNQTTVPICVNPTSLSLQANSTVSVNSPLINQNNQILNQTQLEYQPSVTIQPVCYSNNLQPIINVAPQNQINFTNNKLITSNSFVTQGININNTTINMSQSNRWTKPVGKPAVFTKSQQKLKNPKGRTIIAKRPIDDNDNTIIIPTTSSISTASLTLTSTTSSSVSPISSSSAPSPSSSSSSTSQPTMIVQHLPSTTNFIPTFVDTFPHHQNNQNLQYLTTITTPQISPQPLVQLQTDNNIISLLPGMQPTTMIIQQQPPRILENQLVLDSNGSLSWAPQQITQPIYYGFETIVQNTIMQSQQFLPTTVPGVLTANSSYSTTTQVFQTSKLEPVIADVSTNNFVLLNPGQLMNQSIQVSQNTTQHYQQPQINNNNNNNLNSIIQNKNIITTTATTVPTTTIITTTSTTPTTTTRLTSCPVKYSNANNNSNINNNTNNNNNIILQKSDKQTTQSYTNSNNNTNITLPTSPFISELGIPTNIVTPTPKLHHIVNNNNNNNSNNNNNNNNNNNISNNTNQNRPMSRVLPMQNIKETNSINIGSKNNANHNHNHNNNYNNNINNSIINNNNHHQMDDGDDNNNHNNNNNSNNNNNNNNGDISKNINDKTDIANNLMKDIKTVEIEIRTVDKIDDNEEKILLNDDKQMKIDDDNTKSEPIKMIFHKQTEDGTYKISNLFDKTNTIDDGKLDNFVTKFNDNCTTTTITTTTATVTNNNINNSCNSPENTFKLSNFTKNSPVAPLKPIKSNYTSPILPLGDKLQNCSSIDIIDKKDILSRKQKQPPLQQQQDKKDENSPTILYTIETQDGFKYSSTSLSDMWTKLFETVQNARIANNMPPLPSYYNNMNNNIKLLGLKSPSLKYLIEQLPGVNKCTKYKPTYNFASKLNDIDDEPIGHNYGCVRCLPHIKSNNNNYDMFGWLASRHRRPEPNLNCTDLVPRRSSINNLPMAMRFRQLKLTSKYSVGVYRSKIHRRGLFCLRDFEAGEMVIEYSGEVIRSVLTDKREKYYNSKGIGCYMFRIDDNLVVDATMKGNAARFINHSCDPNCYSKVVEILGHKHIIIFALRRIICGEELTYDYKFPIEEDKIPCTCGTKKCRKFLN